MDKKKTETAIAKPTKGMYVLSIPTEKEIETTYKATNTINNIKNK